MAFDHEFGPQPPIEYDECNHCHAEVPVEDGESVVVHVHRVEGQAVGTDTEFICRSCLEAAEREF